MNHTSDPTATPAPYGLSQVHYAMLALDRAISPAVIQAREYITLTHPDDVQDLVSTHGKRFSKTQARTAPVLAIPLWDVHGHKTGWQIRPDSARSTRGGKTIKYEIPPKAMIQLDVHPSVQPLLENPQIPLWITEGVPKGDALVSAGACALDLMGVWGYLGTNEFGGKVILPEWRHIALNNRLVYVAYDSDLYTNPNVKAALKGLWEFLRSRDAIPCRLDWPEAYRQKKWGVDDFLAENHHAHTLADLAAMIPPPGPLPLHPPAPPQDAAIPDALAAQLLVTSKGHPTENMSNLLLLLEQHPHWHGRFWWDSVRGLPMLDDAHVDDLQIAAIALWCGAMLRIPIRSPRLLEHCLRHVCLAHPRDLLQEWLDALPVWDQEPRLETWLGHVAQAAESAYTRDVSRLLVVSLVARAMEPGCQYRNVVILEGPEDTGKSKLVRTLASPEWCVDFSLSMDSKEAHILIQGVWLAELGELATFGRTADARLKSFVTIQEDVWIPKYSNTTIRTPRRTVFVGTHNPEGAYLPSQTGNTRFLPIQTGVIDCAALEAMREQLFAEALVYYTAHPHDWWQLSSEGATDARTQREARRQDSIYEERLHVWLETTRYLQQPGVFLRGVTSVPEIFEHCLQVPPERWKDKPLQMEVAKALHALHYVRRKREFDVLWEKAP